MLIGSQPASGGLSVNRSTLVFGDHLELDLIETDVQIRRPVDGGVDVLRQFVAGVQYQERGPEEVGQVCGWIGWSIFEEDSADAADAISADAEQLGGAAADTIETYPENFVDAALLVDRMYLDPKWRGRRLSGFVSRDQ